MLRYLIDTIYGNNGNNENNGNSENNENNENNAISQNGYEGYKSVLQYLPYNLIIKKYNDNNASTKSSNNIQLCIEQFCIEEFNKINSKKFVVSLSGGVDSMVLISIIKSLGYNVVGAHINYNNRPESIVEQRFLEKWSRDNNIKLYIKSINDIKRGECKRNNYEILARKIRFDFYKKVLTNENADYMLLAHHKDDIIENIFANICRGRNILDLAVIRKSTTIDNVDIMRPMLDFNKDAIYEYAHLMDVPYFKDTTPNWSVRGKYRNIIAPAIEDAFTLNVKSNLIGISEQSDEWNILINHTIINPFMKNVTFDDLLVEFSIHKYNEHPMCFWRQIFMKIFYHYNLNSPSKRGIQTFINSIIDDHISTHKRNISISDNCICTIKNYIVTIAINDKFTTLALD